VKKKITRTQARTHARTRTWPTWYIAQLRPNTVMHHLMTGIRSEKCAVRRVRNRVNIMEGA